MYLAVFVFVTALYGPAESVDPQGVSTTLAECEARLEQSMPTMTVLSSQFGLESLEGECRIDYSQSI